MDINELNVLKKNERKILDAIKTAKGRLQTFAQDPVLNAEKMKACQAGIVELQEELKQAQTAVKLAEIELL